MNTSRPRLKVFITIDTEIWPRTANWKQTRLSDEIGWYIFGNARSGNFGLPYQLDVFRRRRLRAVFFVEALFASVFGIAPLQQILQLVRDAGQEVQLHLHTEWLNHMDPPLLGERRAANMHGFSEADQLVLLRQGLENFRRCGVTGVRAFRAGNYGANNDTLGALHCAGLDFDTSYNPGYLGSQCLMSADELLQQPVHLRGTWELPVSCFYDFSSHLRPAQLCACSSSEMEHALLAAWKAGWHSFVIVSHSFELVRMPNEPGPASPRRIEVSRFEELCAFLDRHRDKFETAGFDDLQSAELASSPQPLPVRGSAARAAWRMVEQSVGRLI